VLFAIRVSVRFLPYHLGRNRLHRSMLSPCVGLACVVLLIDFVCDGYAVYVGCV